VQSSRRYAQEDELLLLLVQRQRFPYNIARLHALLSEALDWPALLQQAQLHWVMPLLAVQLQRLGYAGVPPAVVAQLQKYARVNGMRNLLLARELRSALQRLMAAGVPVVPFKGIALADALYGDCTLRECTDLDLLVPQAQVSDVVRLLQADGYQAEGAWEQWTASLMNSELSLSRPAARLQYAIDLHWGFMGGDPRHHRAMEALWATTRPTMVLGVEAWAMSPEWELLALMLHAARSQWQGLKWLVDIQEICWTWAIDWQMVRAIAHQWGWGAILDLTVETCQSLWELPLSPNTRSVPCPSWLRQFPAPPLQRQWARLRLWCLLLPRWSQRIGYVLRLIGMPTANDYRWLPLPTALFPLYAFLRPLRWLVMSGRWCLRIARQRLGV
jgi:hypothetical protein